LKVPQRRRERRSHSRNHRKAAQSGQSTDLSGGVSTMSDAAVEEKRPSLKGGLEEKKSRPGTTRQNCRVTGMRNFCCSWSALVSIDEEGPEEMKRQFTRFRSRTCHSVDTTCEFVPGSPFTRGHFAKSHQIDNCGFAPNDLTSLSCPNSLRFLSGSALARSVFNTGRCGVLHAFFRLSNDSVKMTQADL
jgi:hypothetical protein